MTDSIFKVKTVRSVTKRWQDVSAENVERWREAALLDVEAALQRGGNHWVSSAPPDLPVITGIQFSEAQTRAFASGDTRSVEKMAAKFVKDMFGALAPHEDAFFLPLHDRVPPHSTHFAKYQWHRDPHAILVAATSAMPTLFMKGGVNPPFHQRQSSGVVGLYTDDHPQDVNAWAKKQGILTEMPLNQFILSVGRHWHCPVRNETDQPVDRTFLFAGHYTAPVRDADEFRQIKQAFQAKR